MCGNPKAKAPRWLPSAALVLIITVVLAGTSFADYSAWHYSANVDVRSGAYARVDSPVEVTVNFTSLLVASGGSGKSLDVNSIRVVEYASAARTTEVGEKPSQFDVSAGFNAKTYAVGELVWILDGSTPAGTTRYYKVYYDVVENGSMTPPSYNTGLSWNASTGVVETPGYRATFNPYWESCIIKLENKLSGTTKTMWDSDAGDWYRNGQWHTTNEAGIGWIDDWQWGAPVAKSAVVGPVRITVTRTTSENRTTWNVVRKFYAGSQPSPYWKAKVTVDRTEANPGQGIVWLKRVAWNSFGAADRTMFIANTPAPNWTYYPAVYEYGPDGGVGVLASGNYIPNVVSQDNGMRWAFCDADCFGESWRHKLYPWDMDYGFVIHSQTTSTGAETAVNAAVDDYNNPVQVTIANTGTVSGVVRDSATSEPIGGAVVRIRSGSFSVTTYTTLAGAYSISRVPIGSASFSVKADHYNAEIATVSVSTGFNTRDVALSAAPFIDLRSATLGGSANWLLGRDTLSGGPVVPPYDDFSAVGASELGFIPTDVPSDWDSQQGTENMIYGWLRTHVTVPAGWSGSAVRLRNYRVDDVDSGFFNGAKVGQTGVFAPDDDPRNGAKSVTAYGIPHDYWVAASSVVFGGDNVIAMRILDGGGAGGIPVGAPMLEKAPPFATVSGVVSNAIGPVAGAKVTVVGVGSATTAANGAYSITFVPGDVYQMRVSAFAHKDATVTVDVPDTGSKTQNFVLESAGSISGTVTRLGAPLAHCRVAISGPTTASVLTDAQGEYVVSCLPGDYSVVFNALNVTPQTKTITVGTSSATLNVDLKYGLTPCYDAFEGNSLDSSKWELWNMEPDGVAPATDGIVTIADGVAQIECGTRRGGIRSRTYFPTTATFEATFPKQFVGMNQSFSLYAGSGEWGNFTEMVDEPRAGMEDRIAVYGSFSNPEIATVPGYPRSVAMVRTGQVFDFYVNGEYKTSDTSGIGQSRLYLYGYELPGADNIAYFSNICAGTPVEPTPSSIGGARSAAGGSGVSISGGVVTVSLPGVFWIEKSDRSSGVKVISPSNPAVGSVVDVMGRVVRKNREAMIQAAMVNVTGTDTVPEPVGLVSRASGDLDCAGSAAQGMRVTMFGTCTGFTYDEFSNPTGFFVDDGSGLSGDGTNKGFYVPIDPQWLLEFWFPPEPGAFITITGALTVDTSTGSPVPAVRVQSSTDIVF